jgi:hypothetical protein
MEPYTHDFVVWFRFVAPEPTAQADSNFSGRLSSH